MVLALIARKVDNTSRKGKHMDIILMILVIIGFVIPSASNDNNIRAQSILSNDIQVIRVTTQSPAYHFVRVDIQKDPNYEVVWSSIDCDTSYLLMCIASIDNNHPAVFTLRFKSLREGNKQNRIKIEDCWTHYIIEQVSTNSNRVYVPIAKE